VVDLEQGMAAADFFEHDVRRHTGSAG
jgi:hypothetical protein